MLAQQRYLDLWQTQCRSRPHAQHTQFAAINFREAKPPPYRASGDERLFRAHATNPVPVECTPTRSTLISAGPPPNASPTRHRASPTNRPPPYLPAEPQGVARRSPRRPHPNTMLTLHTRLRPQRTGRAEWRNALAHFPRVATSPRRCSRRNNRQLSLRHAMHPRRPHPGSSRRPLLVF